MTFFIIIFSVLIILSIAGRYYKPKTNEKSANKIDCGNYIAGHLAIDQSFKKAALYIENGNIEIYQEPYFTYEPNVQRKGYIPIQSILNISIEDKSTIEKRVTVGRLLLVGIFALAWRKKDVKNSAFLIIEWQGGRFTHETIFEFGGNNAFQDANIVRNKLIAKT